MTAATTTETPAEIVRRTRAAQDLPPVVEDVAVLRRISKLIEDADDR